MPGGRHERRLALAVVVVSALLFAAAAPVAKLKLPEYWAFLPVYQSALVVNDLITAVLLYGQYRILQTRGLLILASAYLFSALMACAHALSFPGLFAPSGVLGGGGQTTAWIYFLWHGGFPLLIIAYALLDDVMPRAHRPQGSATGKLLASIAGVLAACTGLTLLATAGHDLLPAIMKGNADASTKVFVAAVCWLLCVAALPLMWRRRPHTLLDLWLMVVLCVWVFDIALAAVLNGARFDLGWYAGRIYGLLAASFVLVVLLLDNGRLYARVQEMHERERQQAELTLARQSERLRIQYEIDRAIVNEVAPAAIAGAAIQPLREVLGVPRAIVNLFDLAAGEVEWLAAAGRRRTHVGPGVRYPIHMMGDIEGLKRGEPQVIDTHALPPGPAVDALLASGVHVYMAVPMIAGGELIGAISFGGESAVFPPEQVAIAQGTAAQLAIAVTQARLLARVRRHAEDLEERVRDRTTELQAANRELEAFSYSVSHDLRAPLRAIIGFGQMLEEDYGERLDDEGRRLLGVVRKEASRMGQLIHDLLEFSRIGRERVAAPRIDMAALVREVVDELAPQYPLARIEVGELPQAPADRALMKQVWLNLVANALKYSAKAEAPRVEIAGSEANGQCVYTVKDNGAGFDMRYAAKLFGVFQRLHTDAEFQGTGVGLAIVRRVVTRHGGSVWAEAAPQAGATFHVQLPGAPPRHAEAA